MSRHIAPLDSALGQRLKTYAWPGNVRELQNVIERGVITARHGHLNLDYALPQADLGGERPAAAVDMVQTGRVLTATQLQELERENIRCALQQCKWKVSGKDGAARLLGLPPSTLQSRMKTMGIERPE